MKILFFADTPLQLYNSYLLATGALNQFSSSVIVYKQFSNADSLIHSYENTNVFKDIFSVDQLNVHSYKEQFFWQLSVIGKKTFLNLSELNGISFDYFALACPTPASLETFLHLKRINKNLKTIFYEDGTGTYNGNVFRQPFYFEKPPAPTLKSVSYIDAIRRLSSLNSQFPWRYNPIAIYVKKPQLLSYPPSIPCRSFKISLPATHKLSAKTSFGNYLKIKDRSCLFFDIPRSSTEGFGADTIDAVLECCLSKGKTCYLRNHPRSTESSHHSNDCIDFSNGLWELLCQENNFERSLLISIGSTAQLAPFIEADQKPALLFLYKIAFQKSDNHYRLGEEVHSLAIKAYGCKASNIHAPETIDQAIGIINDFSQV